MTEPIEITEIIDAETLTPIVQYRATEAGLAELRGRLSGVVYDVRTAPGMDAARKDRRECVALRSALEAARKAEKEDIVERGRIIDAEAKRIRAAIEELEAPIDAQIKAEEARKDAEKQARAEAAAAVQKRIDWIRQSPVDLVGKTATEISSFADDLAKLAIDETLFAGRTQDAQDELATALAKIETMRQAAMAQEAEAARLKVERDALDHERRVAQEAAEAAQAAAREREAREAAERKAAQDAEDAARRERQAQEDAERKARQDAEDAKRAQEAAEDRQRAAARQAEIDAQAAELARQREAQEAAARAERERKEAEARAARAELEARADPWAALNGILDILAKIGDFAKAREMVGDTARAALRARTELDGVEAELRR